MHSSKMRTAGSLTVFPDSLPSLVGVGDISWGGGDLSWGVTSPPPSDQVPTPHDAFDVTPPTPPPNARQTDACENITFATRAVTIPLFFRKRIKSRLCGCNSYEPLPYGSNIRRSVLSKTKNY